MSSRTLIKHRTRSIPMPLLKRARREAKKGTFRGGSRDLADQAYIRRCTHVWRAAGVKILFTRDEGHHACGWWKNPDFDRCVHLSLSFFDPHTGEVAPQDHKQAASICRAFFGSDRARLWVEPPYSEHGLRYDVWHYRLMCDAGWQPITPRGEVYTREHTPKGWLSWSEAQAMHREAAGS